MSFWPLFFLEMRRLKTSIKIKLRAGSTYIMYGIFLFGAFLVYYSIDIFLLKLPESLRSAFLAELGIKTLNIGALLLDLVFFLFILGIVRGSIFRPTQTVMDKIDLDLNLSLTISPKEVFMAKSLKSIIAKTPLLSILLLAAILPISEFDSIPVLGSTLIFLAIFLVVVQYFYFTFGIYFLTRIVISRIKYLAITVVSIILLSWLFIAQSGYLIIVDSVMPWSIVYYLYGELSSTSSLTAVMTWFFFLVFEVTSTILFALVFSSKYYQDIEQFNLEFSTRINFRKGAIDWKFLKFSGPRTMIFVKEFYQNARQPNFWATIVMYFIFTGIWIYYIFFRSFAGPFSILFLIIEKGFDLLSMILINVQIALFVMYLLTLLSFSVIDSFKKDITDMWVIKSIPLDLKDLIWGKIYFNVFFASITVAPILILFVTSFLRSVLYQLIFLSIIPFFVFQLASIEPYISIKYTPRRPIEEFPVTGIIEYLSIFLVLSLPVVVLFMLTNVSIYIYFIALLINIKYCKVLAEFFVNLAMKLIRIFQEF